MKPRSLLILAAAAVALLSGCATPNLERIATVQNRAEAIYAYGGVPRFPVPSELAEISVYAPVGRKPEYGGLTAAQHKALHPAVTEQTHSPDSITKQQAGSSKTQESTAQTSAKPVEAEQKTDAQKETVIAKDQAATQIEKSQASETRQQSLAPDTQVSEHQPVFHKKFSKDKVTVGEKFEFTLDFQNATPVDLASVQFNDALDSRLKLFEDQIEVKPNFKHHVSVGNGQIVVRFTTEIKRGKRVRVTIPVMFPSTSAAAAQ
jgi:uncharacterized repeat protein (TIGR01451 family)